MMGRRYGRVRNTLGVDLGAFSAVDRLSGAELGAAFPGAGGYYRYLSEIYGSRTTGPAALVS